MRLLQARQPGGRRASSCSSTSAALHLRTEQPDNGAIGAYIAGFVNVAEGLSQ